MSGKNQVARLLRQMTFGGLVAFLLSSLTPVSSANSVTLAWNPNPEPNIAGYRLHIGTSSRIYPVTLEVGNTTSATVSNLTPGSSYFFAVTAYNHAALESLLSNETTYTPPPNQPPIVSLISPVQGATFTAPGSIVLTATANDTDGSISRVEFYNGSTWLGQATASPYAFTWTGVPAGNYSFTARAIDNQGASTTSIAIGVTVVHPPIATKPDIRAIVYLPNGSAQITITGTAGRIYRAYASSDLKNWTLIATAVNQTGTLIVTDPAAANLEKRFYRISDDITTTDPAGFTKLRIAGVSSSQTSASSYLGLCLTNPVSYQGTITSRGVDFVVDTQATWSDNQFNGANGKFYIEIISGSFAGLTTDILATDAAGKKLVIDDDLSSLLNGGELYRIRQHRTIGNVFGPTNQAGLKGGTTVSGSDEVRVFNPVTQALSIYYYQTGGTGGIGWRTSTDAVTDVGGLKLYLDQGVIIRRKVAGDIKLILTGAAKIGPTVVPIGNNSNLIANMYPAGLRTLGNSGLYSGNSLRGLAGGSSVSSADEVRIWSGTAFRKYYYKTSGSSGTGWRSSSSTTIDASNIEIPAGSSFYVVRKKGRPAFNWIVLQPF